VSMSRFGTSPEDETGGVLDLLALKRFEVPPPGYFRNFSAKVISRIEAEGLEPGGVGWRGWLRFFWGQPSLRGALGLLFGALLVVGLLRGEASAVVPEAVSVCRE